MSPGVLSLSPKSFEVIIDQGLPDRSDVEGRSLRFGIWRNNKMCVSPKNFNDLLDDAEKVGNEYWHILDTTDWSILDALLDLKGAPHDFHQTAGRGPGEDRRPLREAGQEGG